MYKQITAGNLDDLRKKVTGRANCYIFIKPYVALQIEKLCIKEHNKLATELNERNITLVLEEKDRILRKVILEQIPVPEENEEDK